MNLESGTYNNLYDETANEIKNKFQDSFYSFTDTPIKTYQDEQRFDLEGRV